MHIKTDKPLTFFEKGLKHSWTITPQMGVVKHFPRKACISLIKQGATDLTPKKSATAAKAKPA